MNKNVLVLGSGFVVRPLIEYLLSRTPYSVIVGSNDLQRARALVAGHARGRACYLDILDHISLKRMISEVDLVVSLLPATLHPRVANVCLSERVHLITTSYISPAMAALDDSVQRAELIFLNEVGLDPGIDHMSAMRVIDHVRHRGGQVRSFESVCGGLPSPEACDNLFGYKFSWSPRGVLLACLNSAHYLREGQMIQIPPGQVLRHCFDKEIETLGALQTYANRDSLKYRDAYGLDDVATLFRGTLRFPFWCEIMDALIRLGYLSEEIEPTWRGKTLADVTAALSGAHDLKALKDKVMDVLRLPSDSVVIRAMNFLGLFGKEKVDLENLSPLDIITQQMLKRMTFLTDQRDMIILQHDFLIDYPKQPQEHLRACLIDYGRLDGDSAMARTVGLPAAIAVKLILEKRLALTGVHIPVQPQWYLPILSELEEFDIRFVERRIPADFGKSF